MFWRLAITPIVKNLNMKYLPNTIINFHAVHDVKWIDNVLKLLKTNYTMVSINEIKDFYYEGKRLKNACHITFDDGDKSFYNNVFPLLKKYNIPASIFISPKITIEGGNFWFQEIRGYNVEKLYKIIGEHIKNDKEEFIRTPIGAIMRSFTINQIWSIIHVYQSKTKTQRKPDMNMNAANILELHHSGLVSIGAHTINHPILKNETYEIAHDEIINSLNGLNLLIQEQVNYFAFPNGIPDVDFSQREINILRDVGVKLAFSTENKTIIQRDNPLSVPRNGISKGSKAFILVKLMIGKNWDLLRNLIKDEDEKSYRLNTNN